MFIPPLFASQCSLVSPLELNPTGPNHSTKDPISGHVFEVGLQRPRLVWGTRVAFKSQGNSVLEAKVTSDLAV